MNWNIHKIELRFAFHINKITHLAWGDVREHARAHSPYSSIHHRTQIQYNLYNTEAHVVATFNLRKSKEISAYNGTHSRRVEEQIKQTAYNVFEM